MTENSSLNFCWLPNTAWKVHYLKGSQTCPKINVKKDLTWLDRQWREHKSPTHPLTQLSALWWFFHGKAAKARVVEGTLTAEDVEKTGGKGMPVSKGVWGSFPGPEWRRSRRLEPSVLLLEAVGPSNRLLKSFGVNGETFAVELNESSPKGEWDSLLSTDLRDPASVRT